MKNLIFTILTFLFLGCSTPQFSSQKRIQIGKDVSLTLPALKEVSAPLEAVQLLTIEKDGKRQSLQIFVKNDGKLLVVTGLVPMGPRFTVSYDGNSIRDEGVPLGAKQFDMTYALADMLLVVGAASMLQKNILPNVIIRDVHSSRDISVNGRSLIDIHYSEKVPWKGVVTFHHLERSYRLEIKTLEVKYL